MVFDRNRLAHAAIRLQWRVPSRLPRARHMATRRASRLSRSQPWLGPDRRNPGCRRRDRAV